MAYFGSLGDIDVGAIDATKAVTAVDVFVYDTRKDSDGGAWRTGALVKASSWYNETLNTATRGARREFPAVAVIVAESNKITIYDGDEPDLPMWMVFNAATDHSRLIAFGDLGSVTCVFMLNGTLFVGTTSGATNSSVTGLSVAEFVSDAQRKYDETGYIKSPLGIYDRNDNTHGLWWHSILPRDASKAINPFINDVAMTVLPGAPIDPATGLPVPTIAVATAGGVSVIKDNGTVVDSGITSAVASLSFFGEDLLIDNSGSAANRIKTYRVADFTADGFGQNGLYRDFDAGFVSGQLNILTATGQSVSTAESSVGSNSGLTGIDENPTTPANGMVAYTTSTYNTGWMPGDIKGAFLADINATTLVGLGELVTNGTFDADTDWTKNTGWTISNGEAVFDGVNFGSIYQPANGIISGNLYRLDVTIGTNASGIGQFFPRLRGAGSSLYNHKSGTTYTFYIVAGTSGNGGVEIYTNSSYPFTISSISVSEADADRSVNNKGLTVNGTITRTAVATGAELVGYSGFSATNYLEQPYNSGLDFGTGDFSVMGWVKLNSTGTSILLAKSPSGSNVAPYFEIQIGNGNYVWVATAGAGAKNFGAPIAGVWQFLTYIRKSGIGYAYLNANLNESEADTNNYNHSNADVLRFGLRTDNFGPLPGSIALWRISATAPTADQVQRIYEDEKVLFQENAACTLYGTSDAVTAMAHDSDTDLLHVGTSAGRSIFSGLRRVDNTTDAVGTAISASNGLVVEE